MRPRDMMAFLLVPALTMSIGCTSGEPSGLPIGSVLVEEKWLPLTFHAEDDGRLYIWDQGHHRMAFETDLRQGQAVWVDFITGWVFVDLQPRKDVGIDPYARHQLFFSRATTRPATRPTGAPAR